MSEHDVADRQALQYVLPQARAATSIGMATRAADSPVGGVSCRLGDASCASAHAATVNRSTSWQQPSLHRSVLRLQRQYGNRYVGRVLRQAGASEQEGGGMDAIERSIDQARGGGQAMGHSTRARMEGAFGADFSGVRIHTDARADGLSQALSARAFATGRDLFFRQGEYNPGTSAGRELLAHELTHVVQQNGDGAQRKMTVSQPGDPLEVEAEQMAQAVMQQEHAPIAGASGHEGIARASLDRAELAGFRSAMSKPTDLAREALLRSEEQSVTNFLERGAQSAITDRNFPAAQLLWRALSYTTEHPSESRNPRSLVPLRRSSQECPSCHQNISLDSDCPTCRESAALFARQADIRGIGRVNGNDLTVARDASGQRTVLQCINANLANAGIPWATITILGGVCGVLGALAGLAGGPAAPATVPSGMALAAAYCIAAVTGLAVGVVLGVITRCWQDPSVEWVFAQNESSPAGGEGSAEASATA